jgi:hypothetical protein
MKVADITFPAFTGKRCLMMPYIQGAPESVPVKYREGYEGIIASLVFNAGDVGYLTIDESVVQVGSPHRGHRRRSERALHTEAGRHPDRMYSWGGGGWGSSHRVTLDPQVEILLANNIDDSCAVWDATHEDTSIDGDIGFAASQYPYSDAQLMKAGEVYRIGILTPHESLPVRKTMNRQFLRIVSDGVHGREEYFTRNELMAY